MSDYLDTSGGDDDEPTAPFWMSTFSDMATLLLTFFVLIVAMSEVKVQRFKEALSYFQGRNGVLLNEQMVPTEMREIQFRSKEQEELYESLLHYLKDNDLEDKVQVNLTERGLHVVITDSVMFNSGQARLIEPSRTILSLLGGMVDEELQSVTVEGHTDDRPISTSRFPSNWELSTARAASVVRFLLQQESALPPSRYAAAGYGEYRPVATNDTPEGRAHNRRVEILFSWEPWQPTTTPYRHPTAMAQMHP